MNDSELHILCSSGDERTVTMMALMYARNSLIQHWWDSVTVILWGASAGLAATSPTLRAEIQRAKDVGVRFTACITCAKELDVVEELEAQDIELKPWGPPLTELLRTRAPLLSV